MWKTICLAEILYYNYKTTKEFTPSDYQFIKVGVQAHVFVFNNSELKYVVEDFQNLPFFYQISDAHKCPLRTLLSKPFFFTRNFKPIKCVKSSCIHLQNDLSERGVQLNKMPLKYLQQMMSYALYRFHATRTKDYYTYYVRMFLSQIEQQKQTKI